MGTAKSFAQCKGSIVQAMIKLTVNGKPRDLAESQDLVSFLKSYEVDLQHVAVGYNGAVLEKSDYAEILLKDGDVLEIVKPVGGG